MKAYAFHRAALNLVLGPPVLLPGFVLFFALEMIRYQSGSADIPYLHQGKTIFIVYLLCYTFAGILAGLLYGLFCLIHAIKKGKNILWQCHGLAFSFSVSFAVLLFLSLHNFNPERTWIRAIIIVFVMILASGMALLGRLVSTYSPGAALFAFILIGTVCLLILPAAVLHRAASTSPGDKSPETISFSDIGDMINVCFITIDTLRADHLHCYGYNRIDTSNIDSLAAEGMLFTSAFCQIPITRPSHTSMLTGDYPATQGIIDNVTGVLDPSQVTIAEILSARGYRTAAFVSTLPLHSRFGLAQGFDVYDDRFSAPRIQLPASFRQQGDFLFPAFLGKLIKIKAAHSRDASHTTGRAIQWLSEHGSEPFFLWVHLYDPHIPYHPPPPFDTLYLPDGKYRERPSTLIPEDLDYWISQYDGEITYTDKNIGRLLDAFERLGLTGKTLFVLTSDHGESFEHNYYYQHSAMLYESLIHIPLIMRFPPVIPAGTTEDVLLESIDIPPTILDILHIDPPDNISGKSFLPVIQGKKGNDFKKKIFAGTDVEVPPAPSGRDKRVKFPAIHANNPGWSNNVKMKGLRTIRTENWKLILDERTASIELYDIREDPQELHNLASENQEQVERLTEALREWLALEGRLKVPTKEIPLDDETKEGLKALGYLN